MAPLKSITHGLNYVMIAKGCLKPHKIQQFLLSKNQLYSSLPIHSYLILHFLALDELIVHLQKSLPLPKLVPIIQVLKSTMIVAL